MNSLSEFDVLQMCWIIIPNRGLGRKDIDIELHLQGRSGACFSGRKKDQTEFVGGESIPSEGDSRPNCPSLPFSFLPKRRPMEDLMLFFLVDLCRES